jgi:23S rRNA pseudouridine1911/1915/1917 synthase
MYAAPMAGGTPKDHWTVDHAEAGTRLDKFLAAAARIGSRRQAVSALNRGKIFLNGDPVGPGDAARPLAAGDVVRLWMDRPGSARRTAVRATGDLAILYEDDALLVLDKPAGLLSVPLERRAGASSVYDQLETYFRHRGKRRPFVVHRIDRDTSGVVLFAKDTRTQAALKAQFRRREPERVYLAVVYGRPSPSAGTWRDRLVWDHRALIQKETHSADPAGTDAICDYRVLETFDHASLIEVRLQTGKRNQIRLQARLRGHTLVGERRYVYGPDTLRPIAFPRQALHAYRLTFRHPANGQTLRMEAPIPADFRDLLDRLRQPAS